MKAIANVAMSMFALGWLFPLVAGPLLSTILERDLSWVMIPGTVSLWAGGLVLGLLSRQTDVGRRAALWSAGAIVIGLLVLILK